MFCSTAKGKESIVRQLNADLHIDNDVQLCQTLQRFLQKFHVLSAETAAETLMKESGGKVMQFRSVDSYCKKITASLNK